LPLLDFHFLDAQCLVDPQSVMRAEHPTIVADQDLRNAMLADRGVEHRQVGGGVRLSRDS
jgi:hypothetical protein